VTLNQGSCISKIGQNNDKNQPHFTNIYKVEKLVSIKSLVNKTQKNCKESEKTSKTYVPPKSFLKRQKKELV
jgi:hypothetical protein